MAATRAHSTLRDTVVFRPLLPVAESPSPTIGLYMSWHTHNPSPLVAHFISLFDASTLSRVEGAGVDSPVRRVAG